MQLLHKHIIIVLILAATLSGCKTTAPTASKQQGINTPMTEAQVNMQRTFIEGQRAKAIEDYEDALKKFQEVEKANPQNAAVHYEIGQLLFNTGNYDQARAQAELATKLEPSNKWYLEQLAAIHMKQQNAKEAIKVYEQLIKVSPNDAENYFDLAYLYRQSNQDELAIKAYDQFEKNYGLEESVILQKEHLYLHMNKFDQAVAEVQKLIDAYPGEVPYMGMLAEIYSLNNRKDKAAEIYRKILEIEPDNAQALMATADISASKGDTMARYESMKKIFANPKVNVDTKVKMLYPSIQFYELRKDKIKESFELATIFVNTHPDNAKSWAIRGDLYYIDKQEDTALAMYLKSLKLEKQVFPVWQQVMFIYNNKRDWPNLLAICSQAMELFPNQAIIYLFRGGSEFQMKEYERALKSFSKGERMANDNPQLKAQIFSNLGDTYHNLNRFGESDTAYDQSLKLDPENAYVLNNYSYYLSVRKTNLPRAKQMSAYANKLDPENDSFMDTYAWILFQLGEYADAKTWQARAVAKNPTSATLLEHLGDIYVQLGDKTKAIENWRKAKQAGSDSHTLDNKIAEGKYIE
jgi:tetratricopeptide (TPR) repeat protein